MATKMAVYGVLSDSYRVPWPDPRGGLPEVAKPMPLPAPEPEPQPHGTVASSLVEEVEMPIVPPQPVRPAPVTTATSISKPSARGSYSSPNAYWAMVGRRIEQNKEYPRMARLRNWEGRVTLQFVITLEGDVREAKVIKGSGFRALDSAALEAVRRAAPFPKPQGSLFSSDVPFTVTFTLRPQNSWVAYHLRACQLLVTTMNSGQEKPWENEFDSDVVCETSSPYVSPRQARPFFL